MRSWTVAVAILGSLVNLNASATEVTYDATKVAGNEWQLTYDVANNSLSVPISELTIYFNPALFTNVAIGSTQPAGWNNPLVVQSDPTLLPDLSGYGFFDTVASSSGIAPGGSLDGFTALVDYSGTGQPSAQTFQIVNPATFSTLDQGQTRGSGGGTSVGEPGTLVLALLGTIAVAFTRARRREFGGRHSWLALPSN
jgi:hypothetical protein